VLGIRSRLVLYCHIRENKITNIPGIKHEREQVPIMAIVPGYSSPNYEQVRRSVKSFPNHWKAEKISINKMDRNSGTLQK
jgi:hypothetical protein